MRVAEERNSELGDQVAVLNTEVTKLRARVDQLRGMDATALEAETERARDELATVRQQIEQERQRADEQIRQQDKQAEADRAAADRSLRDLLRQNEEAATQLAQTQAQIVQTQDVAMLQEAGLYEFRHRLADAVAYKSRLDDLRDEIKTAVRAGDAVESATGWMVNGSASQGRKMLRETTKLMLRAYNAEADACVRTMRPHRLASCTDRLGKARDTIARLGSTMNIHITEHYHGLRVTELELTADYLAKVEEEKERVRAEREAAREEAALRREIERERAKLAKEDAHWANVQERMRAAGDTLGLSEAETRRTEIAQALQDVEARAANVRTGWVYVISNIGAFGQHMVKIGMTRRLDPTERVRELGDASVPFKFDTHALIFSSDAVSLETRLHQELAHRRVNQVNLRREFFYATPTEVRDLLQRIDGQHLLDFTEDCEASEWRASQHPAIETSPDQSHPTLSVK
ncbi:hypothetical protein Athai_46340 [Actinocatenispora thailandica]|uniref:Bacteriophage T5 Orf172 DNA-binding domain-containing protein n=1 Tax=Actinocatenispora thailandica TaxID=227318 RepID=A0A7R7HZ09_9ACTN|nr:DUF4041 domain-containing protein [Actinocatenispora thailandica]BCJ37131.1 hypothetical protein Athai_46340 [Actinocatenispora thailandica]